MRFFLASIVDKNSKAYIRDCVQALSKYKRNFEFTPNDMLHFNYKYLGKDLKPDTLEESYQILKQKITAFHLSSFTHPLLPAGFGSKAEYQPNTLTMRLKPSDELNELYRLIQDIALNIEGDKLVRRKDHNKLLGIIKIGHIATNINSESRERINNIIKELPKPTEVTIDNISIIATSLLRNKIKIEVVNTLPLSS